LWWGFSSEHSKNLKNKLTKEIGYKEKMVVKNHTYKIKNSVIRIKNSKKQQKS
jgi:hypothetical protein